MKLKVILTGADDAEVSRFAYDYGSVFQYPTFLSEVGDSYCCLVAKDAEKVLGVIPLVKTIKNKLTAYHIPPYTHLFSPIIHAEYQDKYHQVVDALLKALPKAGHYDFKMYLNENDATPWLANGFSVTTGQTFIVPGETVYDSSSIHSSKRRYLKKLLKLLDADKISIVVGQNCFEDLLYLQNITGERSRFKTHKKTIKNIVYSLPEKSKYAFVIYDYDGEPLSGAFCPFDQFSSYHLINASKRHDDKLLDKSNILSTYLAVRNANEKGLTFDFEGSSIPGVANFYRMMGGQAKLIYRAQKSSSLYYQILRAGQTYFQERK